ncbi:MAG: ThuA domain-containing protein [Thermomicrobiales bacterium]
MTAISKLRVLVWSEGTAPKFAYPHDINDAVATALKADPHLEVRTATFTDDAQGLSEAALANADVLVWWGHLLHRNVQDVNVERVMMHVRERGMGFVPLHSSHMSKPFTQLIGASGQIGGWKHDAGPEEIKVVMPNHPVARGVSDLVIEDEEMYDEPFDIGTPDAVVFHSTFPNGKEIRSGLAYQIGKGRVFYFRPGHEENPTFYRPDVQHIIRNAVYWGAKRTED